MDREPAQTTVPRPPGLGAEQGSPAEVTVRPVIPAVPTPESTAARPLTLSWENLGGFWGGSSQGLSAREAMMRFRWPSG